MQTDRTRIALMDHHRVLTGALSRRLADEPDLTVVGTAGTFVEALELFLYNEIDVVTLDLDFAGMDGLTVGHRLFARFPDLGIVVVTAKFDDFRFSEAVRMGVRGWVPKETDIETLLTAVRAAARGETHLPASLLARTLDFAPQRQRSPSPQFHLIALLSAQELDLLRCLMDGLSRSETAAILHVSLSTVRTYIQSILHKLNVRSAVTAVAFARQAGVESVREYKIVPR